MSCVISSYTYLSVLHHIVRASSFFSISLMAHISRTSLSLFLCLPIFFQFYFSNLLYSYHVTILKIFCFSFIFFHIFFVLFYSILSYLSHFILYYLILTYLISSYLISFHLILSYIILFYLTHSSFSPSLFFLTVYDTLFSDT